jgi:hypothetical protein
MIERPLSIKECAFALGNCLHSDRREQFSLVGDAYVFKAREELSRPCPCLNFRQNAAPHPALVIVAKPYHEALTPLVSADTQRLRAM